MLLSVDGQHIREENGDVADHRNRIENIFGFHKTAARSSNSLHGSHRHASNGNQHPGKETSMAQKNKRRWVAKVKIDSTHPPQGLFTKSAATIARILASKKVSPKGPGSGMRMLTYFINRAGHGLSTERRAELEKAKTLLSKRVNQAKKRNKKAA
jgi:Protein of unknown function (DUF3175)